MSPLAGPFGVAAALLGLGGASKALDPADTSRALAVMGLPSRRALVRVGGAAELGIGVGALVFGTRAFAVLVAASYAAFLAFVVLAMIRRAPISTCGCFGKADTPPSAIHVVLNALAAGVAVAVALDPRVALPVVLADQPLLGIPFLLLLVTGVYLNFVALTALPRALDAHAARG